MIFGVHKGRRHISCPNIQYSLGGRIVFKESSEKDKAKR